MAQHPISGCRFPAPASVTVRDGIQLFGRDASGVLSTALFTADGTLSTWTKLGAQGTTGKPAVVVYPGYRMRVFATDGDGNVVTTQQSTEGGAFDDWSTMSGVTAAGSPTAVISPTTGVTGVVVRGTDNTIYETGEQTQGTGVWRPWQQVSSETTATDPTAFTYTAPSGPTWAYTFRTQDNQSRIYQLNTSSFVRADRKAGQVPPSFTPHALPMPPKR
jgi:hypothetical protein